MDEIRRTCVGGAYRSVVQWPIARWGSAGGLIVSRRDSGDGFRIKFVDADGRMYRTTVLDHTSVCESDAAVSTTAFIKIIRDSVPNVNPTPPDEIAVSWRVVGSETQAPCRIRIVLRAYENATSLQSKVYLQEAQIASLQLQVAELIADVSKQAVSQKAASVRGRAGLSSRDYYGWGILPNVSDPHAIEVLQSSAHSVVGERATCVPLLPDSCLREYLDVDGVSVSRGETALHYYIGILDRKWTVENEHVFTAIVAELLRLGVDPATPDNRGDTALAWLDRAEQALRERLTVAAERCAALYTTARIRKLLSDAVTRGPSLDHRGDQPA